MGSQGSLWTQLLVIAVLTGINAFFAAAELAYVSVNEREINRLIKEENDKRAKRVSALLQDSDDFLATIQVAITLAGFLSSASAATSFVSVVASWLPKFPGVETVATLIVTLILSYITLVLGELYPKQVALQMPERIALSTSGLIYFTQIITKPFVKLLSASTGLLRKLTPIDFSKEEPAYSREAMRLILAESREEGSIDYEEFSMLEGILSLDNQMAREVMTPRVDTHMINVDNDKRDIFYEIIDGSYSRMPIYKDDKDNVLGVIHIRDVFKAFYENDYDYNKIDFIALANKPLVVPSTIYIDDLLVEFQREQTHMAILKDEYGGVEGIVTMEDVLEEIVGEIEDEYDKENNREIVEIGNDCYEISGTLSVDKFNSFFKERIQVEEVDTMGGLILYVTNYVPEDTEEITVRVNDFILTTTEIEKGRIRKIRVDRDKSREKSTDYYMNIEDPEDSWSAEELEELKESSDSSEEDKE